MAAWEVRDGLSRQKVNSKSSFNADCSQEQQKRPKPLQGRNQEGQQQRTSGDSDNKHTGERSLGKTGREQISYNETKEVKLNTGHMRR